MDTFTCGTCKTSFNDLAVFLNHKNTPCTPAVEEYLPTITEKAFDAPLLDQTSAAESNSIGLGLEIESTPVNPQCSLDERNDGVQNGEVPGQDGCKSAAGLPEPVPNAGTVFLCKDCNMYAADIADLKKHQSNIHNTPQDSVKDVVVPLQPHGNVETVNTGSAEPLLAVKRKRGRPRKHPRGKVFFPFTKTGQVTVLGSEELTIVTAAEKEEKTKREDGEGIDRPKRGRPRKSNAERDQEKLREIERLKAEELARSQTDEQEKCRTCGKAFARLRQLKSHRCQGGRSDSDSGAEGDDDGSVPQYTNVDCPSNGVSELESLDLPLETQPDKLALTECVIPQILNNKALPDLRVSRSASLKVYTCPVCRKVYKTKPSLIVHLSSHTKDKPFKCSECNYSASVKANLQIHMRKHTNARLHCDVCSYSCISKGNLKKHKRKHGPKQKPFYCNLCNRRAYTTTNLLRHLEMEHDIEADRKVKSYYEEQRLRCRVGKRNLIFQCHVCHRKFKDRRTHDQHLLLHQSTKPFKCTLCPYTAIRHDSIQKHIQRHWFIYMCCLCKTKVLSLDLLQAHLITHTLPDGSSSNDLLEQSISASMYQSDLIDKELVNEHNRKNEIHSEGSKSLSPVRAADFPGSGEDDLGERSEINSETQYLEILNTPLVATLELQEIGEVFAKLCFKRLSSVLLREIRALYGDNECPVCGRLFRYRPHMRAHKKTHKDEKDFKCELCSYSSHSKQGLKRHIDSVHTAATLKCPTCDFETTSSTYLQQHRKKHLGSEAFKCTQCGMATADEDDMKGHIASHHPDLTRSELEKIMGKHIHIRNKMGVIASHKCQHCSQVFRRVCDLRRHLWLHNGVNPYKCKLCKFAAQTMHNLKSHMQRHSDTRTHLCHECGKMFKTKNALKTHCAAQHAVEKLHSCTHRKFTTKKESHLKHHAGIHDVPPPNQTFRCFQCTQFTSNKDALRQHYRCEHPDVVFEESVSYEVPEDRITTLNISINHKDGVLHYKCSQCDVLLVNNGELGQHLREVHGLAITTTMEGEGEAMDPDQLNAENVNSQGDLSTLAQESQVQLADSVSDERTSTMQLLQHIIEIQEIAAASAQVDSVMSESNQQQEYTTGDNIQDGDHAGIPETAAAVNYLTTSENLTGVDGGVVPQTELMNQQGVESCQYVTAHSNPQDGSSEVIPDAAFEQEVTVEPEGHMTYMLPNQQRQPQPRAPP